MADIESRSPSPKAPISPSLLAEKEEGVEEREEKKKDVAEDEDGLDEVKRDEGSNSGQDPKEVSEPISEPGKADEEKKGEDYGLLLEGEDIAYPLADMITVRGFRPILNGCSISDLCYNWEYQRRLFTLEIDPAEVLVGELTIAVLERYALNLLYGLESYRRGVNVDRPTVFVGWDIGCLVVKCALVLADRDPDRWFRVFNRSCLLVFCGGPHRSRSLLDMEMKLTEFLTSTVRDNIRGWSHHVTPSSIKGLAAASIEANDMFFSTKAYMSSHIVSFYNDNSTWFTPETAIHPAFDMFTGTLGLPWETCIAEIPKNLDPHMASLKKYVPHERASRFPSSAEDTLLSAIRELGLTDEWAPIHDTLLSLASAQSPFSSVYQADHQIFRHETHQKFVDSHGTQILYIHGQEQSKVQEAIDQIGHSFIARMREGNKETWNMFRYSFNSRDASCNSLGGLLSTLLATYHCRHSRKDSEARIIFTDHAQAQRGWTESDLVQFFGVWEYIFNSPNSILILENLDECDKKGRAAFLQIVQNIASRTEEKLMIVASSLRPLSLESELSEFMAINLDELEVDIPSPTPTEQVGRTLSLLPASVQSQVQAGMDQLALKELSSQHDIIELVQDRTNWPASPRVESIPQYARLMEVISQGGSMSTVMDCILRDVPDQEWLHWILGWILSTRHPLTIWELAAIMCPESKSSVSQAEVQACTRKVQNWLAGIATIKLRRVSVKQQLVDALELDTETNKYVWNEVLATAPKKIVKFCLDYLENEAVEERLEVIFQAYLARFNAANGRLTPPLVSDGKFLGFYVVKVLPHYLAYLETQEVIQMLLQLRDTTVTLTRWSNVFWAMSNPFERMVCPPPSAYPILVGLGLPYQVLEPVGDEERRLAITEAARNGRRDFVFNAIGEEPPTETLRDSLLSAASGAHEDLACQIARRFAAVSRKKEPNYDNGNSGVNADAIRPVEWPPALIWRTAWLGLPDLASELLENAASPEPTEWIFNKYPSPLYLACKRGHVAVVRAFLDHGASMDVISAPRGTGVADTAAAVGHPDVLKVLIKKNKDFLERRAPYTPLYWASLWGNHKAIKTLLELGADPDAGIVPGPNHYWSPLVIACNYGYHDSAKALLEGYEGRRADPNICGPDNEDTPLRFAGVNGDIDICRLLLGYKADPNHELLVPPVLVEVFGTADLTEDKKLAVAQVLVGNDPPVRLNNACKKTGKTPLMVAVEQGHSTLVEWLLEHDADPTLVDKKGRGALYYACATKGNGGDMVEILLGKEPQPSPDAVTSNGETLWEAAVECMEEAYSSVVRTLLDNKMNVDLAGKNSWTLLMKMVQKGDKEMVEDLISRGADVNLRVDKDVDSENGGWSALMFAAQGGKSEIITLLADAGADMYVQEMDEWDDGWGVVHYCVQTGYECVRALLDFSRDPKLVNQRTRSNMTPLHIMEMNEVDLAAIKSLVRAGADINARNTRGDTAVAITAWNERVDVFDYLMSQPDIDINLMSEIFGGPLHQALRKGNVYIVNKLIEAGADVNLEAVGSAGTPLIAACLPEDKYKWIGEPMVHMLLNKGANASAEAVNHGAFVYNALSAAAFCTTPEVIDLMINEGASVNLPDPLGRLPVHFAAANNVEALQAVLQVTKNADLMAKDKLGRTPLHWAAQFGRDMVTRYILDQEETPAGAVNDPDIDGWTPLCWVARQRGNWRDNGRRAWNAWAYTVDALLEHEADRSVECYIYHEGQEREVMTPLKITRLCDEDEEMENLIQYGTRDPPSDDENEADADNKSAELVLPYQDTEETCGICFWNIAGLYYSCLTCPGFFACKKCYGHVDLFHGHFKGGDSEDGRHQFERHNSSEFYFPSVRTRTTSSRASGSSYPSVRDTDSLPEAEKAATDDEGSDKEDNTSDSVREMSSRGSNVTENEV